MSQWKCVVSEFNGMHVIVTGAAGALGGAVAQRFARDGARLALLDRVIVKPPAGSKPDHLAFEVDLLQPQAIRDAVSETLAKFGRIDILCNIAGGFRSGSAVHETSHDLWRDMIDMNATSVLNMASAVVPAMVRERSGKIINVAAMSARSGKAGMGAYIVAKTAVIRLTESMADELRQSGINVNCVLPSIIDTPTNRRDMPKADFSKWVPAEAVADVIAFLASRASRAVHGASVPVVGLS